VSLPPVDARYLVDRGLPHSVTTEGGMTCVLIAGLQLPAGLDRSAADLLIRLSPSYPDVPPDMWWFDPPIKLANGATIPATEVQESYLGRTWQRWSRHFNQGQWRSGLDSLESYVALIQRELRRSAGGTA
jgi:hypothetical protein